MIPQTRLDKWLWHARFTRTRSQASRLVDEGCVRVNGRKTVKAHSCVRSGDVLTIALGQTVRVIRVLDLAERRLGPALATNLYEEITTV